MKINENIFKEQRIIQGLMRINNLSADELYNLIKFDIENGINYFDLADFYSNGECERKFGEVLKLHPELRDKMIIQTKCGILNDHEGNKYFDLSYEHIVDSVKNSLKRMNLDSIDYLLFHRPDIFMDANEVARAMSYLKGEGLVKHFGVSNFPHEMVKFMKDQTNIPIEINQLQLGLGHLDLIREVLNCNMNSEEGTEHTGELFFYMKRYNIVLQCWSPFQHGFMEGSIFDNPKFKELNETLEEFATKYNTSKCAIATCFLLMLSKTTQVITGSTNIKNIKECLDSKNIKLEKWEWYKLYRSTGNFLP